MAVKLAEIDATTLGIDFDENRDRTHSVLSLCGAIQLIDPKLVTILLIDNILIGTIHSDKHPNIRIYNSNRGNVSLLFEPKKILQINGYQLPVPPTPDPVIPIGNMLYGIVSYLKTQLESAIPGMYVGYYPYDYQYIANKMPCVLIKLGDIQVLLDGHHMYGCNTNTLFLLYSLQQFSLLLQYLDTIVRCIVNNLHKISTLCITDVGNTTILTGDINDYSVASQTGYNANIIVRKITQNYTYNKII